MDRSESTREPHDLAALLAMLTLSDGDVAQALGVSPITVRSWRTGRRSPSPENRESLVESARAHAQEILRLARDLERRGEELERLERAKEPARDVRPGVLSGFPAQDVAAASSPEPI
jgi:transposase-like protein